MVFCIFPNPLSQRSWVHVTRNMYALSVLSRTKRRLIIMHKHNTSNTISQVIMDQGKMIESGEIQYNNTCFTHMYIIHRNIVIYFLFQICHIENVLLLCHFRMLLLNISLFHFVDSVGDDKWPVLGLVPKKVFLGNVRSMLLLVEIGY